MKHLFLLLVFSSIFLIGNAEKVYEFNTTCQQAYKEITQLKINNGIALINKAKQQNPDNLIPLVLESYVDFFVLFMNEDPTEFKIRNPKFEERIAALKEGPKNSPFYNFCLGAVYLHKASVNIKFDNKTKAGFDFQTAYKYIKQNQKAFPTFIPNQLLHGALQAVAGTIPSSYKWLAGLFGVKGRISEGMKTVTNFVNSSDPWAKLMFNEACFVNCYLKFYIENKKEEALQFIKNKKLDVVNNHLFAFMAANLAINNKQIDYAETVINNRNKSAEYLNLSVWDFQMGFVKMYHLQTQQAINYFNAYLKNFKGTYYVKDVYQKIGWCYHLQSNKAGAEEARKNCIHKGAAISDADKQALKDAKKNIAPNITLLKARILNDGGYNNQALATLQGFSTQSFNTDLEKLEFTYRVGRINDDLGKDEDAIAFYLKAIALGETRTEYYAARAALQIGQIYEQKGNKKDAIRFYEQCINMEDHDYKNSLDQRAKSGISRCKGE